MCLIEKSAWLAIILKKTYDSKKTMAQFIPLKDLEIR
tara:strand:+ start:4125 stop:4235 length:111 start_codon:yes stop_codon:yes gene_type:complete